MGNPQIRVQVTKAGITVIGEAGKVRGNVPVFVKQFTHQEKQEGKLDITADIEAVRAKLSSLEK